MNYGPNEHYRHAIRLNDYDYSQEGAYFVTMCVQNRECLLGDVVESEMRLSAYGEIVAACWDDLPNHYPTVELDVFAIMPNHVHGIIVLKDCMSSTGVGVGSPDPAAGEGEETSPLRRPSLGQIVAYFKYQTTKLVNGIRKASGSRFWQRNYHERVIRNERELDALREYTVDNPLKCDLDEENPINNPIVLRRKNRWLESRNQVSS